MHILNFCLKLNNVLFQAALQEGNKYDVVYFIRSRPHTLIAKASVTIVNRDNILIIAIFIALVLPRTRAMGIELN